MRYSLIDGSLALEPEQSSTDEIRLLGVKKVNTLAEVSVTGTGISFTRNASAADTIGDTGSGLAVFSSGDMVRVSGSTSNDGEYLVTTAVAGTLTLHTKEFLTTEAAGATITLTTVSHLHEDTDMALALSAAWNIARLYKLEGADYIQSLLNDEMGELTAHTTHLTKSWRAPYREW